MGLGRLTYFLKEWIAQSTLVPRLAARTKPLLIVLGLLLLLLVALVQAQVPADLEVGLLYLLPVATIAWAGGRLPGLSASVAAVGVQLLVDAFGESPPSAPAVPYWNLGVSLVVFLAFSEIMPRLHRALDAERERARTDALTGLGNRRFLEIVARAELGRTRRYHRPFALGYIDVDYFKEVNDRLGHLAGDQLLKLIAREIRRVMRISDVVARVGGDEFALLLPETPPEGAEVAFRKVHKHLSGVVEREGFPVSFSIGVVTCESTVTVSLEELLREADEMMYMVKNSGRGSIRLRALREAAAVF
jgi:diguanylate cyclase (GGDEF)-like protein